MTPVCLASGTSQAVLRVLPARAQETLCGAGVTLSLYGPSVCSASSPQRLHIHPVTQVGICQSRLAREVPVWQHRKRKECTEGRAAGPQTFVPTILLPSLWVSL